MSGTLVLDCEGLSELVHRTPELTVCLASHEACVHLLGVDNQEQEDVRTAWLEAHEQPAPIVQAFADSATAEYAGSATGRGSAAVPSPEPS